MYSKIIDPVLFFLFLIKTFKPIFSVIESSSACKFASFDGLIDCLFTLKIFTKFSVCRTESFFSIIFFAKNAALFKPIKILPCPDDIFFVSIYFKTSSGSVNSLKKLAI